jgi:hypothetical protein
VPVARSNLVEMPSLNSSGDTSAKNARLDRWIRLTVGSRPGSLRLRSNKVRSTGQAAEMRPAVAPCSESANRSSPGQTSGKTDGPR